MVSIEHTGTVTRVIGDHTVLVHWDQDKIETEISNHRLMTEITDTSQHTSLINPYETQDATDFELKKVEDVDENTEIILSDSELSDDLQNPPEKAVTFIRLNNSFTKKVHSKNNPKRKRILSLRNENTESRVIKKLKVVTTSKGKKRGIKTTVDEPFHSRKKRKIQGTSEDRNTTTPLSSAYNFKIVSSRYDEEGDSNISEKKRGIKNIALYVDEPFHTRKKRKMRRTSEDRNITTPLSSACNIQLASYDEGDSSISESSDEEEEASAVSETTATQSNPCNWKKQEVTIDMREKSFRRRGAVYLPDSVILADLAAVMMSYLPMDYIKSVVLPLSNVGGRMGPHGSRQCTDITLEELLTFFGLLISMECYYIPDRKLYWKSSGSGLFSAMNFGKFMAWNRLHDIMWSLTLSSSSNEFNQIRDFVTEVNKNLLTTITAGEHLCIDESMVKAFHKRLRVKVKIRRKPRPIGTEIKAVCDGKTKIVV